MGKVVDEPKHKLSRIASSAAVKATPGKVYRTLLVAGAGAAGTFKLTDDANGAGTAVIDGAAVQGTQAELNVEDSGPIMFPTKIYATVAGTGAVLYVWWD